MPFSAWRLQRFGSGYLLDLNNVALSWLSVTIFIATVSRFSSVTPLLQVFCACRLIAQVQ
jgi:hypothetical protein